MMITMMVMIIIIMIIFCVSFDAFLIMSLFYGQCVVCVRCYCNVGAVSCSQRSIDDVCSVLTLSADTMCHVYFAQ